METLAILASGTLRLVSPFAEPTWATFFVPMFEEASALLPSSDRLQLERYWRERDAPASAKDKWQGLRDHQPCVLLNDGTSLPMCTQGGHVLTFSIDVIKKMGYEFAIKAIAHELAHAVLYIRGDEVHWAEGAAMEKCKARERAVDALLRTWGIDQSEVIRWSRAWDEKHHPDSTLCIWEV